MLRKPTKPLETLADHLTYLGHDIDYAPKHEAEPTSTWPSTAARVEEYRRRVEAGQPVFHPGDATLDGCTEDLIIGSTRGRPLPGRPRTASFVNKHQPGRRSL